MMKKVLASAALALSAQAATAADPAAVTVILSSASPQTQGMAMVLANQMLAQGAKTNILLCDQAGDLAIKNADSPALKPKNISPAQMLDAAMQQGSSVSVCALYLPNSGHTVDDLKDGIRPAQPQAMAEEMLEPSRKVFSF